MLSKYPKNISQNRHQQGTAYRPEWHTTCNTHFMRFSKLLYRNPAAIAANKLFTLVIFCLCLISSFSSHADNVSTCFSENFHKSELTDYERQILSQHKVVFIEGLLNETAEKLRLGYFSPQKDFLDSINVPYEVLQTNSEEDELYNANLVHEQLKQITEQTNVIIFTHSRGGILSLRALLLDQDLWPKVSGWIALQSPFEGTALADKISAKYLFKKLGLLYLEAAGSNADVFSELTTQHRLNFSKLYKEKIKPLLKAVRVLTVGSIADRFKPTQLRYYTRPNLGIVYPDGSDGVVTPTSTILRVDNIESSHILWSNIGHRDLVFPNKKRRSKEKDAQLDLKQASSALFKTLLQGEECASRHMTY